jgi:hypothetical protein
MGVEWDHCPLMANVFMCVRFHIILYKRFVDGILSKMPSIDAAADFLIPPNALQPRITFTMETSIHGKIPFISIFLLIFLW